MQRTQRTCPCGAMLRTTDRGLCASCEAQTDRIGDALGLDDGFKVGDRVAFTGERLLTDGPITAPNRTAKGTWHGEVIANYGREVQVRFDDQIETGIFSVFKDFGMRLVKLKERGTP